MSAAEYNDPRLKILAPRAALRALAAIAAILLAALGIASLPWTGERVPGGPRVLASARGAGALQAGVAEVRFALPPGTPIGGFARLSYRSAGNPGPVGARALVVAEPGCRVALVSAELLLVPESLEAEVAARVADLGLTGLVVAATHTHAGPGGYVEGAVFERIATGPFDPAVREAVVRAIVDAIRSAAASLAPARLTSVRSAADDLARSRSGGLEDAPLTVVRLARADGAPLAELTVFAAHATLLGKRNHVISGDWPGRFLQGGTHGLRLFFQGAIGDQSTEGPSSGSTRGFANVLSSRVDALRFSTPEAAPPLAFATVEFGLPTSDVGAAPWPLGRAARNLAARSFPATGRVEAIRLGPVLFLAVPAEPVSAVAAAWRTTLPPEATIVSLANGYVGYVEEASRMATRSGETNLTYYGPTLAAVLGAAVQAAAGAADPSALPGPAQRGEAAPTPAAAPGR
jgi:hypothetical protein